MQAEEREYSAEAPKGHFISYMGLEISHEEEIAIGRAIVTPQMWAPGTRRPRLGLLFALADVVGGHPHNGPIGPTVDLRLHVTGALPTEGPVLFEARPLKAGRRIWTGQVLLMDAASSEVFAISEVSFLNRKIVGMPDSPRSVRTAADEPRGVRALPAESFDELFDMRVVDGIVEMDIHEAVRNGVGGTIQGGVQATLAEVAAEQALIERGRYEVSDIHVRYLNPAVTGPVQARPEVLAGDDKRPVVRVSLVDAGADERLVSTAVMVCRPAL
jgi:acyl-coenzyme A thioesterase PaaI-like protein